MSLFGEKIKHLRELQGLLQRDVAQKLAIDAPMLSKIEKGERNAKRGQVVVLSKIFNMAEDELILLWIADKVYAMVKDEDVALKALSVTEEELKINSIRKKSGKK